MSITALPSLEFPVDDTENVQHVGSSENDSGSSPKRNAISPLPPRIRMHEGKNDNSSKYRKWSWPLLKALREGIWPEIGRILDTNEDAIDGPVGVYEDTPLVLAIREGLETTIISNLILRMPFDKVVAHSSGRSALEWAILNDNIDAASLLTSTYPLAITPFERGLSPVNYAASNGSNQMYTFLHSVTYAEPPEIIGHNGPINNIDTSSNYQTWSGPLLKALRQGIWHEIKIILDMNEDAIDGPVGVYRDTPLVVIIKYGWETNIINKLLRRMRLDKVVAHSSGRSALEWAIICNNITAARLLIQNHPVLANIPFENAYLPIKYAASYGNSKMYSFFQSVAYQELSEDTDSSSSEWTAESMNNAPLIADGSPQRRNTGTLSPQLPTRIHDGNNGNSLNDPIWSEPLHEALRKGNWHEIKKILDTNEDAIDGPVGEERDTPLVLAIKEKLDMDIIYGLIQRMPLEKLVAHSSGASALEWAILNNDFHATRLLMQRDPHLVNIHFENGLLPVDYAASSGTSEMCSFLQSDNMTTQLVGSAPTIMSSLQSTVHNTETIRSTMSAAKPSLLLPMRDFETLQQVGSTSTDTEIIRNTESMNNAGGGFSLHKNTLSPQSPPRMHEDTTDNSSNYPNWSEPLHEALRQGNWHEIERILDTHDAAINGPIGEDRDTPLVVAIREGLETNIIKKLVERTPIEKLAAHSSGCSALEWAVSKNNIAAARMLIRKDPHLAFVRFKKGGFLPVEYAASDAQKSMYSYLGTVTYPDIAYRDTNEASNSIDILQCVVASGMYDYALDLIWRRKWTWNYIFALDVLVENSYAFPSGTHFNMLQEMIYCCISVPVKSEEALEQHLDSDASLPVSTLWFQTSGFSTLHKVLWKVKKMLVWPSKKIRKFSIIKVWPFRNIHDIKRKHHEVLKLVKVLCTEIRKGEGILSGVVGHRLISAVKNGIPEIVNEIIKLSPDAINYADDRGNNILQLAAMYRHEKILHIIYQKIENQRHIIKHQNADGNNILHLVSFKPLQTQLDATSGVVLKMQRELQWYKGLEKLVPSQLRYQKNTAGKIPFDIFDNKHKGMLASEGEWIKNMAQSCIVGGSLISTVAFAVAVQVPGGSDSKGSPHLWKDIAFKVFAFSDAIALVSSFTTVVTFLSVFTTRYSVESFLYDLPNRLMVGLMSLLLAFTSMMIAVCATIYLLLKEDYEWVIYPTAIMASVPVIFFAYLQLPSLLNLMISTYGPNIFKHDGKMLTLSSENQ